MFYILVEFFFASDPLQGFSENFRVRTAIMLRS